MKSKILGLLIPGLTLAAVLASGHEEKKIVVVKNDDAPSGHGVIRIEKDEGRVEKVPVTFLGVETAPTGPALAAQLDLPTDTGLVVVHVAGDSPASTALKVHDILMKLDDQILIDSRQLSVLVRSHKEGDEVALTIYRGGKQQVLKVKLGKRDLPRIAAGPEHFNRELNDGEMPELRSLGNLPGLGRDDVGNVMRMIGREHQNWFAGPPVHFFRHHGDKGSTILSLADGNFVFSDEAGSVEVTAGDGKRELTVKNPKGEVTFKGPISTEDERKKLPAEVVSRLDKIEKMDVGYEQGDDFEQDATAIKPPGKSKISLSLARREIGRPTNPF